MSTFFHVQLRTSHVDAARDFYQRVLGDRALQVFQLHEQAVARGARPHWLGSLQVADVDETAAAFAARGATLLSPKWVNPEGLEGLTLRDPGGAVVGLCKPASGAPAASGPEVIWYGLNTNDVESAKRNYGELLGWAFAEPLDLGKLGVFHPFAWERGGALVGSMSGIEERAGVHPHWLFHFRVAAFEPALASVREGGGEALEPIVLARGDRVAMCHDPQGAAFVIRENAARVS